jgi:thiamine kinase-like enzyme
VTDLVNRIEAVPELKGVPGLSWRLLEGGLSNTNLLIKAGGERLVLRLNSDWPGIDRKRERRILESLGDSELCPEVIANNPDQGYLLTRFVEQPAWRFEQSHDPECLTRLAGSLRRLHDHPFKDDPVNLGAELIAYLSRPPVMALPEFAAINDGVANLVEALSASGFDQQRAVLCHNDLLFSNILAADRPILIDWEFAACGNRLLDLAIFIHYHNLDPDQAEPLLLSYFGGPHGGDPESLQIAMRVAQALELLWLVCRADRQPLPERPARRLSRLLLVWG